MTVEISGTGGGFQKFCAGETDISDASRPIKDSELEACHGAGIDPMQVTVGYDYAYYAENQDKLKLVSIDNGNGCVEPTPETVQSGEYAALSRPLFIYLSQEAMERPEVYAGYLEDVMN